MLPILAKCHGIFTLLTASFFGIVWKVREGGWHKVPADHKSGNTYA